MCDDGGEPGGNSTTWSVTRVSKVKVPPVLVLVPRPNDWVTVVVRIPACVGQVHQILPTPVCEDDRGVVDLGGGVTST